MSNALAPTPSPSSVVACSRNDAAVLTEIYRDDCNIAIWERQLSDALQQEVTAFLAAHPQFSASTSLAPATAATSDSLGRLRAFPRLAEDISELVDMFCCLFDVTIAGLRLTALAQPMCPRFHVDHVPCRLVTTFQGPATQWLAHEHVNRDKLGSGSKGKTDETSGLYSCPTDTQQASPGDILLLKGERWAGNEGRGLVHRSPAVADNEQRLLLTLDLI
ncbi:hypothetical protein BST95_10545 [Halioglobus japonicus]|uniref:DUF1826 domain-containing protein n=1 Tax=Halioglobus japonicus TaxID=930805 RepID=A0AAP8MFB2_9GAMM|nr:DUF1826 domain-containing protein [Halioglobus japonicus]AQA18609.1 hypothetical protein BST95_10545 [Halioglobus japonicus]PLW86634.1 DUF1826 domain-containing protein [Halioglobus japonicus]GHD11845.1 hypothetical protein GCM10007052_12040 [Halioglobus japonicus]